MDSRGKNPLNVRNGLEGLTIEQVQNIYRQTMNNDKVCCLNIKSEANIGMIMRTASLFGMGEMITLGKRKFNARTSIGAESFIPLNKISASCGVHNDQLDIEKILTELECLSKTHQIIFIELSPESIDFRDMKKKIAADKPVLFVLGSENGGIPEQVLKFQPSVTLMIPQKGVMPCFNVSIAFSIVASMYYYGR